MGTLQPDYLRTPGRIARPAFHDIQDEMKILKQQPKPHVKLKGLRGQWLRGKKLNSRSAVISTVDMKLGQIKKNSDYSELRCENNGGYGQCTAV
ncbi:unnamed protein product [Angiostrongylus costaricensis]|uniref:Ig-like domain-containing protein n=1 Tax=Angiostrongylus costaricensis TaxID=334426 RepID=A0A0R3PUZ3_ANGCS|nr:unnamed protein product [Angiostrongylus costaricensis]